MRYDLHFNKRGAKLNCSVLSVGGDNLWTGKKKVCKEKCGVKKQLDPLQSTATLQISVSFKPRDSLLHDEKHF